MTKTDTKHYTEKEWMEEGEKRFGKDKFQWKFICPICGNIQTPEDFRPYKNKGAGPNDAFQQCLGRITGGVTDEKEAHKSKKADGTPNCNWAAFGLFSGPSYVKRAATKELPVEKEIAVFNFAEAKKL